jgi:kynurenine formamidase
MPRKTKTRKYYKKGKTQKKAGSKSLSFFIFILGLVVLVYTLSFVKRLTQTEAVGSPDSQLIRVQILNGCGAPGAAQSVADFLLTKKFEGVTLDVIDVGNFTDTHIPQTLIWDRVGDLKAAQKVAQLLNISEENVSHQLLKKKHLKVLGIQQTLILGKDYQKILEVGRP